MREKCQLMQDHNEDLDRREAEIESMRIVDQKKENEKVALKQRLEEARKEIAQLQKENSTQRQTMQREFDVELERIK